MSQTAKISKMFGALVLGGGVLLASNSEATPPAESNDDSPAKESTQEAPPKTETVQKEEDPICQLGFTLTTYDRERVIPTKTCLDGKSDEEILKIINEAKKKTCQPPFCGCWLG